MNVERKHEKNDKKNIEKIRKWRNRRGIKRKGESWKIQAWIKRERGDKIKRKRGGMD